MNRTEYLHESIQTWNELEELNEIVVVDYSSEKPILQSDLPKPKFGKKMQCSCKYLDVFKFKMTILQVRKVHKKIQLFVTGSHCSSL